MYIAHMAINIHKACVYIYIYVCLCTDNHSYIIYIFVDMYINITALEH